MSEFTEKNKNYFDDLASSYNSKFEKPSRDLVEEIRKRLDWIGVDWMEEEEDDDDGEGGSGNVEGVSGNASGEGGSRSGEKKVVRVLDYACGTGLITRALAPYATHFTGLDISPNMITQYNLRATNQGIPSSEMHAIQANLLDPNDPSPSIISAPEFFEFDLAVVGLGFHHFEDPRLATRRLAERLRRGGVLLIVDFLKHGKGGGCGCGHGHGHGHSHVENGNSGHGHSHGDSKSDVAVEKARDEEGRGKGKEGESRDEKAKHTVKHMGFSRDEIEKMFLEAGVGGGFDYVEVGKGVVFERFNKEGEGRRVFMARGRKV